MQPLEDGEGAVRGAVVDEDQLRGDARRLAGLSRCRRRAARRWPARSARAPPRSPPARRQRRDPPSRPARGQMPCAEGYPVAAAPHAGDLRNERLPDPRPPRGDVADNAAPMLTRDRAGRILRARWPPLVALIATLAYAVVVIGFGLDFRPLHNDEGVTLGVASRSSALDVLRVAVDHRHGPPLHYLLVHAALAWRHDILGLRLPSALFGIVAVAVSYGFGRELVGRAGGAVVAVVTASSPIMIHLGQFARGYTAMIAAAYASAWLMLVLLRTGRARWVVPYAVAALLLVSAHPFGLFALLSELVLFAGLAAVRLRHGLAGQRRLAAAVAAAILLGGVALVLLRHLYAPLQNKYGVGSGTPVIELDVEPVLAAPGRRRLGLLRTSGFGIALGAATLLGLAALAFREPPRRRAGGGVAGAADRPALGAHRGVERLRPRAPPVVPSARLRGGARGVRARGAPPPGGAVRRLGRGRGARRPARAGMGGRPQRACELQRQPARREPVHGRPLRPRRCAGDHGGHPLAGRGPAPGRRLRGAGRPRLLAAQLVAAHRLAARVQARAEARSARRRWARSG